MNDAVFYIWTVFITAAFSENLSTKRNDKYSVENVLIRVISILLNRGLNVEIECRKCEN